MVKLVGFFLLLLSELLLPFYRPVLLKNAVQINMDMPVGEDTNDGFVEPALTSAEDTTSGVKEVTIMRSQAGLSVTAFCGIAR